MRELLKLKGIKQQELSKMIKVSQQGISRWCNGTAEPRIREVPKLAKALGVSIEEIVRCFVK